MFLVLWGLITHGTFAGTGDEPHYMMIARSLATGGDLDLADDYADPTNPIHLGQLRPESHARPGRDGTLRPVHDVGLPLLFTPWFAVSHAVAVHATPGVPEGWLRRTRLNRWLVLRHLLSFGMMALAALLATQLFDAFAALTPAPRPMAALAGAALAVLSPPLLTHAYLFFAEVPTALLAFVAWRMLAAPRHDRAWLVRVGFVVGFLVLLHARNVGLAAALAVLAWRTPANRSPWLAFGLAVPLAVRTLVNFVFWGSFVAGPHARLDADPGVLEALREALVRLGGLLLDQEHGLLPYAPVYLLAVPGWLLLRRAGAPQQSAGVVVLAYLLPVLLPWTNVHGWRGGWSPAARMLTPIAPFLAVAAFAAALRWKGLAAALALLQLGILQLLWRDPKLAWNDGDGYAEYADALVPGGAAWLPRFVEGGAGAWTAAALITAWTLGSYALARWADRRPPAPA